MPEQRSGSAAAPDRRSAFPGVMGVPAWGAVVIAVAATLLGIAIEAGSGHHELGSVFAMFFAVGCIAAVLAVRRSGIFTAVVQPPLLLFVAVPVAYYLFHGSSFNGLKDAMISCGYPLIERFPLMLFTSAVVLVLGLARRYFGGPAAATGHTAPAGHGLFAGLAARLSSPGGEDDTGGTSRPRHADRRTARAPRSERSPRQGQSARSRQARPIRDDEYADAPRSRRQPTRRSPRDIDAPPVDPPRRRPRPTRDTGSRTPPREPRPRVEGYPSREPREPRTPRPTRASRFEPYESYPPRRPYPPREDYPPAPPRRRPAPDPRSGNGTHHPVSRVRYRGPDPEDRRDPERERSR